ncbi:MAG: RNA polymerase sigma-70 factor (ECF subfamily) [Kiritimatiellia bacterium]|jgi:RNA polymerase sigma-70 factor (ECF subfamily)
MSLAVDTRAAPPDQRVTLAKGGDVRAFEELYRDHAARVLALCLRMTADRALAEDHTQQAFVKAWRKLHTFRQESSFATWIRRIAVRIVLDDMRSAARRLKVDVPAEPSHHPDPSRALDLERAITTLPVKARQVFVLHDVEGLKHQEIAELMGVNIGTSKSQLSRARKLLREALRR